MGLVAEATDTGAEGIVIGCLDDTAYAKAAALAPCLVIGQTSFRLCALRQWRFSVVTTMSVSVPVIERNAESYGLSRFLGRVRASEVPVLDLEMSPGAAVRQILSEAERAVVEDGAMLAMA